MRYGLVDRRWSPVMDTASHTPGTVLSVAYDHAQSYLYVLDIDHDPKFEQPGFAIDDGFGDIGAGLKKKLVQVVSKKTPGRARLLRYALESGTSQTLATWPATGATSSSYIVAHPDGSLVLVAGYKHAFLAFRYRVGASGLLFNGVQAGVGTLLGQPLMAEDDIVIAVSRKGGVYYETLNGFRPGAQCSGL